MKKLLSILLAVICILTITNTAFVVFAEDEQINDAVISEEISDDVPDEPIVPDVPDEPDTPDEPEERTFDVTMYLCSTASTFTGHVWLYFVNNSNVSVTVGCIELQPGKGMSVGSLSYFRNGGGGTYYNAEAKMATDKGLDKVCQKTYSLEMQLTEEQLEKVNNKITSMDFYSYIFWNCGAFAVQVWNSVSDKDVVHIVLPVFTVLNMCMLGAKKGEVRMQEVTNVYKQTKGGYKDLGNYSFDTSCV